MAGKKRVAKRTERTYSDDVKLAALIASVQQGGPLRAGRTFSPPIPEATIRSWEDHPKWKRRLAQIRAAHAREVDARINAAAGQSADLLLQALDCVPAALSGNLPDGVSAGNVAALCRELARCTEVTRNLVGGEVGASGDMVVHLHMGEGHVETLRPVESMDRDEVASG